MAQNSGKVWRIPMVVATVAALIGACSSNDSGLATKSANQSSATVAAGTTDATTATDDTVVFYATTPDSVPSGGPPPRPEGKWTIIRRLEAANPPYDTFHAGRPDVQQWEVHPQCDDDPCDLVVSPGDNGFLPVGYPKTKDSHGLSRSRPTRGCTGWRVLGRADDGACRVQVCKTMGGELFDVIVMVDWSASSTPKLGKDSIWSCTLDATTRAEETVNHRTRAEASDHLVSVLVRARGRRVLIGFDFSYAYPTGMALAAGISGRQPWDAIWRYLAERIVDAPDNRNNRFEVASELNAGINGRSGFGPLWGTPPSAATASLSSRKAPGFPHVLARGVLDEYRITERRFLAVGRRVFSTWHLLGAGSVGSQTLTGIPVVHNLRRHPLLAHRSRVWPFETGLTTDPSAGRIDGIVHAEIWPGAIDLDSSLHEVRDAAQVIGLCRHFAALDATGALAADFDPPLTDAERPVVLAEEGWVLGAPHSS